MKKKEKKNKNKHKIKLYIFLINMNNIFVSIANYRDNVCIDTIDSLFMNAKNPDNIFVGICQQNNEEIDMDCVNNSKVINKNNIRIIRIPYYDAKGPVYARYLCSSLIDKKNEKYYMQIDSHTIFIKHWDQICINMIDEIKTLGLSKKPVLSYYPKDFTMIHKKGDKDNYVPLINGVEFNKEKQVFNFKQAVYTDTKGTYIKTPFATAGMFFCETYFLNEMPFDPTLDHLFTGEEILNSIKFYTNGWDIFVPKINIIFHEYLRNNKPKYWNEPKIKFDDRKALNKVRYYLFNNDKNSDPYYGNYKLGSIRPLEDYYKFANIDINYYKRRRLIPITIIIFITIVLLSYIFFRKIKNDLFFIR